MGDDCWDLLKECLMEHKREWLDFIQSWCDDKSRYIKEVGFPYRKVTRDLEQTFRQLLFFSAQMHNDTYMTVYSFRKMKETDNPKRKHIPDYSTAMINKIYWELDFDHDKEGNLDMAYEDCMKLMDFYNKDCRVYFTTNRGFHIYLDMVICQSKEGLRNYTKDIIEGLRLRTADLGFMGDTARIMRIPYIPHSKTKQFIVPVHRDMSLRDMIDYSSVCHIPKPIVRKPRGLRMACD